MVEVCSTFRSIGLNPGEVVVHVQMLVKHRLVQRFLSAARPTARQRGIVGRVATAMAIVGLGTIGSILVSAQVRPDSTARSWLLRTSDHPVSFLRLICAPREYLDSFITVTGYLRFDDDNCALYLSKDFGDRTMEENGVWLRINDSVYTEWPGPLRGPAVSVLDLRSWNRT